MKKRYISIILVIMVLSFVVGCGDATNTQDESIESNVDIKNEVKSTEEKDVEEDVTQNNNDDFDIESFEYDELQQLYLALEDIDHYEDFMDRVKASGLPYNEKEFSSAYSVKVAFNEGVTKFSHADSGDYLKISFDKENLHLLHAEYFNNNIFIALIDYRNGTYWSFRDQPEYAGYYVNTYDDISKEKFTIKYDNGNETKADYINLDSRNEQFKFMIKYSKSQG